MGEDIRDLLARSGLLFMRGALPKSEDGVLIAWTGGCNALAVCWREDRLFVFPTEDEVDPAEIECWMRLPHPSFWVMIDPPAELVPERDLYGEAGDALRAFVKAKPTGDK